MASEAFLTPVPEVSVGDAAWIASRCFARTGLVGALSGERDRNFRVHGVEHETGNKAEHGAYAMTLKFINPAERADETHMQIDVLKHLQGRCAVPTPLHIAPVHGFSLCGFGTHGSNSCNADPHPHGADLCVTNACALAAGKATSPPDWLDWQNPAGLTLRVRAYSFLEGRPGAHLQSNDTAWFNLGRAVAILDATLASFHHEAASRHFLWDARRAPLLRPWLEVIENDSRREQVRQFWDAFEQRLALVAPSLPMQVIHNDLSPSNLLASEDGLNVAGVLDFGDMLLAPRIAELAVAASYQMALTPSPMYALQAMLEGFDSQLALTPQERECALDFVLARLTQRMVITAWRARRYPENRAYILRSQAAARDLFDQLIVERPNVFGDL